MHLGAQRLWLGVSLWASALSAAALGFGQVPITATLGQPLQLAIPLRLEPGEDLRPECLSGSVSFADNLQQPGTTSFRLDAAPPGVADRVLRLSTTTRVDEPLVTVEITVGCGAKVSRRFTLFADPPLLVAEEALPTVAPPGAQSNITADPVPPGAAPVAARRSEDAAATAANPATSTLPRNRAAPSARRDLQAAGARTTPLPRAAPAPRRAAPSNTARLRLAPLEVGAALAAAASAAEVAAAQATAAENIARAASTAEAASAAVAEARARVAELDAKFSALRAEAASAQQQTSMLQLRLQRAEEQRYQNLLVYALVAALALALGAIVWLARQRQHDREANEWLAQASGDGVGIARSVRGELSGLDPATAEAVAFAPLPTLKTWVSKPNAIDGFDDTLAVTRAGPASMSGALSSAAMPLAAEQRREVSVEELIDLEQQAEFFVVLGQDAAAIDLLMGHLRSAGSSPLPYLKLLEIHKRRGERPDYERLRERFNSRFNAYAPAWETDLQDGLSLEDYPAVIQRLQGLWSSPQRAMEVLQASLLRAKGAGDDAASAASFELPAYRELMLLYSVARDLSEAGGGASVDLLLPIGEESADADDSGHGGVFERLLATTTLNAEPSALKPMQVDLTLEDLELRSDDGPAPKPPDGQQRG